MANIGATLLPISLFWLGWAIEHADPWPVLFAATVLFGASQISIFNTVQTYYIDAFTSSAASALAAGAFLRSLLGGVIPLFVPDLFTQVGYGWGILILAGGGAYYFAKRSINADREERARRVEEQRQSRERARVTEETLRDSKSISESQTPRAPNAERPQERDPAPVEHAHQESKFEAKAPWRSRKGDRFS